VCLGQQPGQSHIIDPFAALLKNKKESIIIRNLHTEVKAIHINYVVLCNWLASLHRSKSCNLRCMNKFVHIDCCRSASTDDGQQTIDLRRLVAGGYLVKNVVGYSF
jgi:hypothetical protein